MRLIRLLIVALLAFYAVPADAQQWDQVNGSMQVKSGPTAPLVIIDQTASGQKIISLRANGTEVCYATATAFTCTGGFTFPTSCTGTYTGPFTNGVTSTGSCVNGSAVLSVSTAVTSTVPIITTADGTVTDPSVQIGTEGNGWYRSGSNGLGLSVSDVGWFAFENGGGFSILSNTAQILFGTSQDVSLSRGAANRFDVATGDSLYLVSGGLGVGVANVAAGTVATSAAIGPVAGITSAGLTGVPVVVGVGRVTAQTDANASISTFTVGAADASFEVSANMNVTASTVLTTTLTCTYTDESNTARTMILPVTSLAGTFVTAGAITGAGATVWETPVMHIRAKAATAITILTSAGTFTGVTYTAEGVIKLTK